MNLMDMVLAMFAVVFFTTVSMTYNRSVWKQAEYLDNAAKTIQAIQTAHSYLDEIDAKLFSKQIAFTNVISTYTGTRTVNLSYVGYTFIVTMTGSICDTLGVVYTPATGEAIRIIKMSVSVASMPGMPIPINVERIYIKTNYNL